MFYQRNKINVGRWSCGGVTARINDCKQLLKFFFSILQIIANEQRLNRSIRKQLLFYNTRVAVIRRFAFKTGLREKQLYAYYFILVFNHRRRPARKQNVLCARTALLYSVDRLRKPQNACTICIYTTYRNAIPIGGGRRKLLPQTKRNLYNNIPRARTYITS